MSQGKGYEKWWILIFVVLIMAIIAGGIALGLRKWSGAKPAEITLQVIPASTLDVYLSGAVAAQGIYTLSEDSSLGEVLQTAGGLTGEADLTSISIHIPTAGESLLTEPQRININRAEAWLLEALPEIGPTLAQRIIDYREQYGQFQQIEDLKKVPGIGEAVFEKIKDKITVVD